MREPNPETSSVHRIGRFAAGFGFVGLSVAHAAWQMLTIANDGQSMPLKLFMPNTQTPDNISRNDMVISQHTARRLRDLMDATVLGGTASSAFRRGKYRSLRFDVGGKTGTLGGSHPDGITTWFAGIYPLDKPEVVVAAVTVLERLWHFKAPNLAAEALYAYKVWQKKHPQIAKSRSSYQKIDGSKN
jgi:cell division protein FtsI/penicillin-binding protein 2